MKSNLSFYLPAILVAVIPVLPLRAQFVSDGATNTLSNMTNSITGGLTVGTNGSFTLLILSDNALLTNSANGTIGLNATAKSNEVRLASSTARWFMGNQLIVGSNGAFNRLVISNGAAVRALSGALGLNTSASNNAALITGTGSVWSNLFGITLGFNGAGNQLVLSNGGALYNANATVGLNSSASNTLAVVTGPGSLWSSRTSLQIGYGGTGSRLVVSNGGFVGNGTGTMAPQAGVSNVLTLVTGTGSTWSNAGDLYIGHSGTENQVIVSEGGTLLSGNSYVGANFTASNNLALITGPGSTWSNAADLNIGAFSSFNRMIVSNGATVVAANNGIVGPTENGNANLALVTGAGLWQIGGDLYVGSNGALSSLVVNQGGQVANRVGIIGFNSSSANNLALVMDPGSSWTNFGEQHVGDAAGGNQLIVSNGATVFATAERILGVRAAASSNTVVVTDAGSRWLGDNLLEIGGHGSFNRLIVTHGGLVTAPNESVLIGNSAGANSNRVVVADAGSLLSNQLDIVVGFDGSFSLLEVSNGAAVLGENGAIGFNSDSEHNEAWVSGVGSAWTNRSALNIGYAGSINRLIVSNGACVVSSNGSLGMLASAADNSAVVIGAGSRWLMQSDLYTGSNGAFNALFVSDGGLLLNSNGIIGFGASSVGNAAIVSGAGSVWSNRQSLVIGDSGNGNRLEVNDGARVESRFGIIGDTTAGSNNEVVVTGPGSLWRLEQGFEVGYSGSGNRLVISNGAWLRGSGTIGYLNSSNNEVVVTGAGSSWTNASTLSVGGLGSGNRLRILDGGEVFQQSLGVTIGAGTTSTNNQLVVDGGSLRLLSPGTGILEVRHGTLVFNAGSIETGQLLMTNTQGLFQFNGGSLSVNNSRVSNGTLLLIGDGASPATYRLAGNGLHQFTGILAAFVSSNATFTGNGTIVGLLQFVPGSRLVPGTSVGQMTFSNAPALRGSIVMEISKNGASLTNDQIQVAAPLTYGGSLLVSNLGPTALAAGDSFRLFSASAYNGAFSELMLPKPGAGLNWTNRLQVDGSIEVVSWNGPTIGNLSVSGTNLIFSVTDGFPGGAYDVLTATNVATPLADWMVLRSGNFDWIGNATLTNDFDFAESQRYFTVRVP